MNPSSFDDSHKQHVQCSVCVIRFPIVKCYNKTKKFVKKTFLAVDVQQGLAPWVCPRFIWKAAFEDLDEHDLIWLPHYPLSFFFIHIICHRMMAVYLDQCTSILYLCTQNILTDYFSFLVNQTHRSQHPGLDESTTWDIWILPSIIQQSK